MDSRHSFSFGPHYDPANTGFGLLVAHNHDVLAPGAGFDPHEHRDMEIVTWVLRGTLTHQDSAGNVAVVTPGLAQRMSAGTGIVHSERNDGPEPVDYVQMWVRPDTAAIEPEYEQAEVDPARLSGSWATVASDRRTDGVRIQQQDAALHVARLRPGQHVDLPAAPYLHLYVAIGAVDLAGVGRLDEGDAVRVTDSDGQQLTAATETEVLAWEMHAATD